MALCREEVPEGCQRIKKWLYLIPRELLARPRRLLPLLEIVPPFL